MAPRLRCGGVGIERYGALEESAGFPVAAGLHGYASEAVQRQEVVGPLLQHLGVGELSGVEIALPQQSECTSMQLSDRHVPVHSAAR